MATTVNTDKRSVHDALFYSNDSVPHWWQSESTQYIRSNITTQFKIPFFFLKHQVSYTLDNYSKVLKDTVFNQPFCASQYAHIQSVRSSTSRQIQYGGGRAIHVVNIALGGKKITLPAHFFLHAHNYFRCNNKKQIVNGSKSLKTR